MHVHCSFIAILVAWTDPDFGWILIKIDLGLINNQIALELANFIPGLLNST